MLTELIFKVAAEQYGSLKNRTKILKKEENNKVEKIIFFSQILIYSEKLN